MTRKQRKDGILKRTEIQRLEDFRAFRQMIWVGNPRKRKQQLYKAMKRSGRADV